MLVRHVIPLPCKHFQCLHIIDLSFLHKQLDVLPYIIRIGKTLKDWSDLLKLLVFLILKPTCDWDRIVGVEGIAVRVIVHDDTVLQWPAQLTKVLDVNLIDIRAMNSVQLAEFNTRLHFEMFHDRLSIAL
jgi:hypothetical protein